MQPSRFPLPFLAFLMGGAACVALVASCASGNQNAFTNPCRTMQVQIREKQELDARVKASAKRVDTYRKQGDTAAAAEEEQRLRGLMENQRLLKESVEQSSRDCHPQMQDPVPVRDPARRETIENPR